MEKKWFALKVHTCCERKAENLLQNYLYLENDKVNVETFLPMQRGDRDPSTGEMEHRHLVIEGILFVRIEAVSVVFNAIRNTPYVLGFYHKPSTHVPAAIPTEQLERLQQILHDSPNAVELVTSVQKGDTVRVRRGELKGLVGTVMDDKAGGSYICVTIDILGQSVRTHIDMADVVRCDSLNVSVKGNLDSVVKRSDVMRLLTSIDKQYKQFSTLYPSQFSDEELCHLVRFYMTLLQHPRVLNVLKEQLWKDNLYGYQQFFAEIYSEAARRVKGTRLKEKRAPLLHALHLLCDQVSFRAYTRKTSVQWVAESVAATNVWYTRHNAQDDDCNHFVQLLMDAHLQEEANMQFLKQKMERWFDELSDESKVTTLAPDAIAPRLQLLADYTVLVGKGRVTKKSLQPLLSSFSESLIARNEAATSMLLLEAQDTLLQHSPKLAKTDLFKSVRQSLPVIPVSFSSLCLQAICDLHLLHHLLSTLRLDK